ncbi:MAG: monovalent cation/H+ antiporter complex subunit F [Actinomycetes bacterium]|nr:monovalent cation/H+ antiporter complex subunit F [Actinomycetes bacterium]
MTIAIWAALAILSVGILLGLYRIVTATDGASRAVVGDLVYFSSIGIMVLLGVLVRSAVVVDAALIASVLGIVATIALARILTRGER